MRAEHHFLTCYKIVLLANGICALCEYFHQSRVDSRLTGNKHTVVDDVNRLCFACKLTDSCAEEHISIASDTVLSLAAARRDTVGGSKGIIIFISPFPLVCDRQGETQLSAGFVIRAEIRTKSFRSRYCTYVLRDADTIFRRQFNTYLPIITIGVSKIISCAAFHPCR